MKKKRAFDLVISISVLILFAPIMLIVALMVLFFLGPPIFFKQLRPGLQGKPFLILKFRTMIDAYKDNSQLCPDVDRLNLFGQLLRKMSIDELPELFNVIKGDMSLIGPRPLLMQYQERYTPEQRRRCEVKPGITGWAQVNGRNAISWEEKFKLDVWYVDHWSLWLDVKIIGMTIWKILKREGISHPGQATMEEFKGTNHEE